jgi:formylglycine-generating enzyme required for sulfatase activity
MGTPSEPFLDWYERRFETPLPRIFYLSDQEISIAQYKAFVEDKAYPASEKPEDWKVMLRPNTTQEHPVEQLSWIDALKFCNWLSQKEGRTPCYERSGETLTDPRGNEQEVWQLNLSVDGYRLPTIAESEYACRACSRTNYSFGNDAAWLKDYATYGSYYPDACRTKLPNGWGFFDMHGNVSEWCTNVVNPRGSVGVWGGGYSNLPIECQSMHNSHRT